MDGFYRRTMYDLDGQHPVIDMSQHAGVNYDGRGKRQIKAGSSSFGQVSDQEWLKMMRWVTSLCDE